VGLTKNPKTVRYKEFQSKMRNYVLHVKNRYLVVSSFNFIETFIQFDFLKYKWRELKNDFDDRYLGCSI
jgi:hypothetical protein